MQNFNEKALAVTAEVSKAVLGKPEAVLKIMMAMLARGHVLIEDIPGVGKTTLAQAFARAMDLTQNRVQFTPDVLPSDIVGFSLYQKETGKFVYHPGAVACNLFLADEINRTSARTQSALLEVMEEGAVTVDGVTRALPQPFTVMATENPVGSVGTQMLPESQLDRFMVCVVMGYPDAEAEMEILARQPRHALLDRVQPVIDKSELLAMQQQVDEVFMSDEIRRYIVELSRATRQDGRLALGLSPRASLAVAGMARAAAFLSGRNYVTPQDVTAIFADVGAFHDISNDGEEDFPENLYVLVPSFLLIIHILLLWLSDPLPNSSMVATIREGTWNNKAHRFDKDCEALPLKTTSRKVYRPGCRSIGKHRLPYDKVIVLPLRRERVPGWNTYLMSQDICRRLLLFHFFAWPPVRHDCMGTKNPPVLSKGENDFFPQGLLYSLAHEPRRKDLLNRMHPGYYGSNEHGLRSGTGLSAYKLLPVHWPELPYRLY